MDVPLGCELTQRPHNLRGEPLRLAARRYHLAVRTTASALLLLVTAAPAPCQAPSKELAEVAAAYAAKIAASAIFVSGRTLESVLEEELAPTRPLEALIRPLLRFDVDSERRTVTCTLGQAKATARHRSAMLGCTLVSADAPGDTPAVGRRRLAVIQSHDDRLRPWPFSESAGATTTTGIDPGAVQRALDAAFAEADPKRLVRTRAVVVVHRGQLVAERYADGYTQDMPLPGWSMTKSMTNALLGFAVQQGRFALGPRPADGARDAAPDVYALLTMTAGKRWNESYDDPSSDVLRMLFRSADHAATFADAPQAEVPGTSFQYASGATNLLCRMLREAIGDDSAYHALPQALFGRLGMRTAVLEADPSGTFVGSSYGFASARDWARLGLLFLQDGVWRGQRLLPEGWVENSRRPVPTSNGRFGWHLWLNADPDGDGPRERRWPDLPADLLHMDGHEGQCCVMSPTTELVVVRLGCTKSGGFDLRGLLRDLHAAVAARR